MSEENNSKLYNFSVLFTYVKTTEEKDKIITAACTYTGLSKKDTYEILKRERSKIQSQYIEEMAKLSRDNNDMFIENYKIKDQIPQDQLPCIFNIDMFGKIKYSKKGINDLHLDTKNLRFISKIDINYKCSGFRT